MTSPSPHAELERLLSASVDGELSDADEASLRAILREDQVARQRYLQFMQLHAELHWDHGASASLLATPPVEIAESELIAPHSTQRVGGWLMLAVALGTLAAGWLLAVAYFGGGNAGVRTSQDAPTIANLEMTHGMVSFQTANGESLVLNGPGQALPAGSLLLEGESSAAQWRFLDGTLITVSGDADVSFSEEDQKLLRVRQGILTAEVQPQPVGHPLVVETRSARVEVLGTVFTLAADPDQTRVNVAEGRVRLKRLVDGQTVEVSGEHSCVASLDARGELLPEGSDEPAIGWNHTFPEPPPERWKGEWLPAEDDQPARVRSVACLVGRKHEADDRPIVHYGITARRVDAIDLGVLPADGVFRMRFRTARPSRLHIMLGLNRADGGFGGNFEVKLPKDSGQLQAEGWRELVVPLSDFHPITPRWREMPPGARPNLILVTTFGDDAGLEVSELAIERAEIKRVP